MTTAPTDNADGQCKKMVGRRDISPPGGWVFRVMETGFTVQARSIVTLRNNVMAHLRANGIRKGKEWDFEDELCKQNQIGDPFCIPAPAVIPPGAEKLTVSHIERFVKTMWRVVKSGFALVDAEEANRRAAICAQCPLNVDVGFCEGCRGVLKRVADTVGDRSTPLDNSLRNCAACGCVLRLKVWVPTKVLDQVEANDLPPYTQECWRRDAR